MSRAVRWISETDVVEMLDLGAAIDAIEDGLAAGSGSSMEKTQCVWEGGTLHALGGALPMNDVVGAKVWAHSAKGATPLLVLWRASDGTCIAVIEAFALGQLRTAAVTAVGTRWLSEPTATHLAIIGSGRQALPQVAAVVAVRPIESVAVFSPDSTHREALAARVRGELGIDATAVESVRSGTLSADIIITATRAREPFLHSADVRRGAHVSAVGAIGPDRRELAPDLVQRCDPVVVDSIETARRFGAELMKTVKLRPLAEVVARGERPAVSDISLFKAMGIGLADVILGAKIVGESHIGNAIPHPVRSLPRLLAT